MTTNTLLNIQNLTVSTTTKILLKKINLQINNHEIHILMGPNGSGKSTLAKVLVGHPLYKCIGGDIFFLKKNLLSLSPIQRSHLGIFLGFQTPIEIPGISNYDFLYLIYNTKKKYLKQKEVTPLEFFKIISRYLNLLNLNSDFLNRNVNENFSGGEKKKNEILQMLLLQPKLIILDEIDSGLDMDILKLIFNTILLNLSKKTSLLIITHNPKILIELKPTFIHIMNNGEIIKTGNSTLLTQLENQGFQSFN